MKRRNMLRKRMKDQVSFVKKTYSIKDKKQAKQLLDIIKRGGLEKVQEGNSDKEAEE